MDDSMLLTIAIIVILLLLFLTVFLGLVYSGLFTPIQIDEGEPPFGNLFVAYKYFVGPYKNAGECFTETSALVPQGCPLIGIYYDDPSEVPVETLRYIVGAILAEGDQEPDELLRDKMRQNGYRLTTFPKISNAVMTSFPHTTMLSIYIGILRVYPQINTYCKTRRLTARPCLEIYSKGLINFLLPLSMQDNFYVEETECENLGSENDEAIDDGTDQSDDSRSDAESDGICEAADVPKPDTAKYQLAPPNGNGSSSEYEVVNREAIPCDNSDSSYL